mgnify:CR=1 FL=1
MGIVYLFDVVLALLEEVLVHIEQRAPVLEGEPRAAIGGIIKLLVLKIDVARIRTEDLFEVVATFLDIAFQIFASGAHASILIELDPDGLNGIGSLNYPRRVLEHVKGVA